MISAIVPTLDEASQLEPCLAALRREPEIGELLVVDGGSRDATRTIAASLGNAPGPPAIRVLEAERGRARQLDAGARAAHGTILWFVHADARVTRGSGDAIVTALQDPSVALGAFRFALDHQTAALRLVVALTRWRGRWLRTPYGDQGLFLRRADYLAWGGFPDQPILEDLALVRTARRHGRIEILSLPLIASARRWRTHGVLRVAAQHQAILWLERLGIAPSRLARWRASR
jgi:rSAM/selenodomain-associated transferase 2